ncbi:N(4)-bis(aminopropyl)spermidine synthase [Thermus composti]|uniref:N(4)-bis(aminopropyl)spermidine synthase n=1 Tax=Thermus composti TaxID=532059 RepID=A0ABV6Q1W4_9DEIN|nr:bis-aminopropyl spermidine synthase family protein [Thermus composti]GGM95286.1 N(4)-bis(aminopropyl)spermidine synthase [Thermus composti]
MWEDLVQTLQETTGLPVSRRDVERALGALKATEDLWENIRLSRVPLRVLVELWRVLQEKGLLRVEEGLALTEAGRALAQEAPLPGEAFCPACEGRGVLGARLPGRARERFLAWTQRRPPAIQDYDQGYVTPESTLARVALAWAWGDLEAKEILVLGDDDLTGLAAALTGLPKRVVVLDADPRIVRFLEEAARAEGLPLEAHVHDLREPLPETWVHAFHTFFTDPVEGPLGLQAFVGRGLLALKGEGCAGYVGLTHVEASLAKWAQFQRFLLENQAVITELRDGFHLYENWDYIPSMRAWPWLPVKRLPEKPWYTSALIRLELLGTPSLPNEPIQGDLQDEEATTY